MSYQGADDDTVWFGSIDHVALDDEKEGVLSEEQVHALAAEYDGIGVAPVPDVPEVNDIPDEEEEQVDDLDAEDDWFGFALIPDMPEVADQEQVHVPAVEDDMIDYAVALVALFDEDAAYLEYILAALNIDQVPAGAVQSAGYFEDDVYSSDEHLYVKDLEVPYYDIHPLKKAVKLGAKGMLKKKGNLAPRRALKLSAKIRKGGSYGTSQGTAIITYGSYGENGLEF